VISAVGGLKIPPVDKFIAGYQAGAKAANAKAKVIYGYSQSFTDQGKCKELALNQIAQGARAVFQVAGGCGLGALSAAQDKGVWGIGVDNDQAFLGAHMLTSAVKRVDAGVFRTIKQAKDGTFKGYGNTIFSVRAGGVGLGTISKKVSKVILAQEKILERQIKNGKVKGIPTTVS
jgi:basic membrane protein A